MASKAEYLKKYLSPSEPTSDEKRKKKRKTKKVKNVRIHDDDLDWKKLAPKIDEYDDDPEEAPVVIDITGDDPETNFKWKAVQPASPVNLSIVKVEKSPSPSPSHPSPNHQQENTNQRKLKKKRKERADSPDFSPPRRKTLKKEPNDLSPPRRGKSPNDMSPPRRRNSPGDISPPRKRTRVPESNSNSRPHGSKTAPPRTKQHSVSSDSSPPRKQSLARPRLDSSQSDLSLPRHSPPPAKILGSKRAGLQSGDAAQEEVLRANAERERFIRSLDPLVSGRNATTVYRNKGKRIDPNVPENPLTEEEKKKKEEDDLQFAQWGRGVAQIQSAQNKVEDDIYEMSKPLARYRDDEDLEKFLKEREREDDPMLKFLTKKKKKKNKGGGNPRLNRPTFKGSWPQNRFGIPPGYRWDGVDRSNGYENKRYALKAEKESIKEFAYKWSVEEM